jgi:hypothetical protein
MTREETGVAHGRIHRTTHSSQGKAHVEARAQTMESLIGNGICRTSAGTCMLRAAIQESNALNGHLRRSQ